MSRKIPIDDCPRYGLVQMITKNVAAPQSLPAINISLLKRYGDVALAAWKPFNFEY